MIKINQDDNYFYSTLSFQLLGTEADDELAIQNVVYRMVLLNKRILSHTLCQQQKYRPLKNDVNTIGTWHLGY